MMQLFANLLDALTTNVTQLPTNAQPILVTETLDSASTLQLTAMITMHVLPTLAILLAEFACTLQKSAAIKASALSIAATLALENASSLTFLHKRLQLNHQINVSPILAMQF